MRTLVAVILIIVAALAALAYTGYVELPGSDAHDDSSDIGADAGSLAGCPLTSCDAGNCCHDSTYDASIATSSQVYAVLTPADCACPSDTDPEPLGIDTNSPGGPYKMCRCR